MKCENQLFGEQFVLRCMKQKLQNTKSNSHGSIRLGVSLATVFAVFMLTACSDGNGTKSFHSSDEAIREYHGFLSTLRQCDKVAIQSLAKTINEWRVLDDSVTSCISRDTVRKAHSYPFAVYRELNDSIHIELCRMAMSKQRTFHDLLYLREQTSSHAGDEKLLQAAKEVQPFFTSLDSLPIYKKGGKKAVLRRYQLFLQKSAKQGIHDKEDLHAFIKEEHLHFKSFLQYLPDFAGDDIGEIRRNTEQCCREILRAADRKELSHKDAMIYLSMRTNLRLLRNAQAAIEDMKSGVVKNEHTMYAYLLMMMQPFMSMDDLSVSVLSNKDKANLYKIADALPKEMDYLAKKLHLDKQRLSDMPMLMMKIYITGL